MEINRLIANINKFILNYIICFSLTEFIYSGSFPDMKICYSEMWVHTQRKQTDSNHVEARVSDWPKLGWLQSVGKQIWWNGTGVDTKKIKVNLQLKKKDGGQK